MKRLKMIYPVLALLATAACSSSNDSSSMSCEDRLCNTQTDLSLDKSDIISSQAYQSDGIRAQGLLDNVISLTPTLTLVGTLNAPTVNGATVQASDITLNGTKVYVAYNTAGNVQAGAIDVIDISSPTSVSLASEALYPTTDIHKVVVNNGKLYAAGADGSGALLTRINLDSAGKLTSTISTVALRSDASAGVPAYAGTSVLVNGNYVYATSGSNGGLSVLNLADLSTSSFAALPDARDISMDGASNLYVVTGKTNSAEAAVKKYNLSGVAQSSGNLTLAGAMLNDEGKSSVISGNYMHIVTAGYGGARLICMDGGTTLGYAANPALTGLTASEQTANAASFGGGYMYVANGEAGVSVYSVNTPVVPLGCSLVTITYLGRITFGTDASVNNVKYTNGYLVVATGSKGFKIVKITTSILSGLLQAL